MVSMGIDHSNPYIHSTTVLCDNNIYVLPHHYNKLSPASAHVSPEYPSVHKHVLVATQAPFSQDGMQTTTEYKNIKDLAQYSLSSLA